jgi:hypothetical protein
MTSKVADVRGNAPENIVHAADVVGRSKARRAVFEEIYRGKKKIKTVDDLMQATRLERKAVLNEGKRLAGNGIVTQTKVDGRVAYEKDDFFVHHKKKVLALVDDPSKREKYPTKREPRVQQKTTVQIRMARSQPLPQMITIDDIESFAAVRQTAAAPGTGVNNLLEERVKRFLQKVIGETHDFKDWGGERNDLYTNKLRFRGRRRGAAFALKGRATKGPLTPKKMGKNGDQLGRLFGSEAELFFVVYHSKIDEAVTQQMRVYGLARAMSGGRVYYCTIDGDDLARLIAAYPKEFAASAKP